MVAAVRALRARDARLARAMTRIALGAGGEEQCITCGRWFTYCDRRKVPTVSAGGHVWRVCLTCVEWGNRNRTQRGLPLITIPPGAYEPLPS